MTMSEARNRIAITEMVVAIGAAAAPLIAFTDFSGRIGRTRFLGATIFAVAGIVVARAMDWLVFGAAPGRVPLFFAAIAASVLGGTLPALSTRRLHDAGSSGWSLLLALVPILGWALLARRLLAPSARPAR